MQLLAEKRGGKYFVSIYGLEHEVLLPKEDKKIVKKTTKKSRK